MEFITTYSVQIMTFYINEFIFSSFKLSLDSNAGGVSLSLLLPLLD